MFGFRIKRQTAVDLSINDVPPTIPPMVYSKVEQDKHRKGKSFDIPRAHSYAVDDKKGKKPGKKKKKKKWQRNVPGVNIMEMLVAKGDSAEQ